MNVDIRFPVKVIVAVQLPCASNGETKDLEYTFHSRDELERYLEYWQLQPDLFSNIRILNMQTVERDVMSWDQYFMEIAKLTAKRSKDCNTQVGCCIVDTMNRIVGTGYNWLPRGLNETEFPTSREGKYHETKYAYMVHAEANAILNSPVFDLSGSRLYCTLFPCNECAKLMIQKGIKKVIYGADKQHDFEPHIASRKLFDAAGIETIMFSEL